MNRGYLSACHAQAGQIVEKKAIGEISVNIPLLFEELIGGIAAGAEGLAGEAGMLIIKAVIDHEVERITNKRYERFSNKEASRWGSQPGYVVFAGRKVDMERPRVRNKKAKEVELKSYRKFQRRGKMQESVLSKMIRPACA